MNLLEAIEEHTNVAYTENGARAFATTQNSVLDYFSQGGAIRSLDDGGISSLVAPAWNDDPELTLKAIFYFRDVRGGQGQRDAFRKQLLWLSNIEPDVVIKNIGNIPEYGRWDDVVSLIDSDNIAVRRYVIETIKNQLTDDMNNYDANKSISLLAKWLPSENASSPKTKKLAKKIRAGLDISSIEYRKLLSKLRKRLKLVEQDISSKKWSNIDYKSVPSNAMLKYRSAFYRNDERRFSDYIDSVNKGNASIHAGTLYPYEIVGKILSHSIDDTMAQAMWDNLPDYIDGGKENSIAVVDTSGSMNVAGGVPMQVALSIGLYMAERADGPYKDHFITFSKQPDLQKVVGNNITSKVMAMKMANWDFNTDIKAVFDLILNAAIKNGIDNSGMVEKVYIISDMEFDSCASTDDDHTLFQVIKKEFEDAGYKMPLLVFWNVNAANKQFPMKIDDRGFINVSGFSPSILKSLLGSEIVSPYDTMLEVLNSDRYKQISV